MAKNPKRGKVSSEKAENSKDKEAKVETEETKEVENPSLITYLQPFVQFMRWDHGDANYF